MKKFRTLFKTYLIAGLIILLPVFITVWIFKYLIVILDELAKPIIRTFISENIIEMFPFGLGIIATFMVIILTGIIGKNIIGQFIIKFSEKVLNKLPIIPKIYTSIKQVLEIFLENQKDSYKGVVIVEYPRRGLYTLALITGKPHMKIINSLEEENLVSLFVPTAPNPISGFYIVCSEKEIKRIDMSIEEAFRIIISSGILSE